VKSKIDLSKICAFYISADDEDSHNVMEELRQEQKDFEALEATMLQDNAANEKQFFERKARDAKLLKLLKEIKSDLDFKTIIPDLDVIREEVNEALLLVEKEEAKTK